MSGLSGNIYVINDQTFCLIRSNKFQSGPIRSNKFQSGPIRSNKFQSGPIRSNKFQ